MLLRRQKKTKAGVHREQLEPMAQKKAKPMPGRLFGLSQLSLESMLKNVVMDLSADSHIFDGVTPFPTLNSFMLIDITDEIARPYIDATGPQALRDKPDDVSGWYTAEQWEKIRIVLQLRFHFLANQGIPAPAEKCAAAVALVEARFRDTGSKGRQESPEADDDDMSEQSDNVQ